MAAKYSHFIPARPNENLRVGLVLRLGDNDQSPLFRITHLFEHNAYLMPVSTPEQARYAKRPQAILVSEIRAMVAAKSACLGRIPLPPEFRSRSKALDGEVDPVEAAMSAIEPLLESFNSEFNLQRFRFATLIIERAKTLGMSHTSLRRLVLRFYYFGRVQSAVLPLRPGPSAEQVASTVSEVPSDDSQVRMDRKRSGRQPVESKTLGRNEFVRSEEDIRDMIACLHACARRGITTIVNAHREYLKGPFSKRHPETYEAYLEKKCPLPITLRQYRTYVREYHDLSRDLLRNVPALNNRTRTGALLALGPGEIYEIDATGGRIFLVDSKRPDIVLGTPVIYLLIDRWSRFVVSFYITLRPASWEEIRYALLIAFTSRKRRFKNLGVNVDENRWPIGRVCATMVADRGSEMISYAMLQAAAKDLLIEPVTMPPLCPDGKGIIERLIREIKRKMTQRRIKGVYAERPLDPVKKRVARKAREAAVHSLREIYWDLFNIVDAHNNSPHSALIRNGQLKQAQVKPTPRDAYVWGLENVSGIQSPPLTDEDYQRLLLGVDKATIANGCMMYRGRKYLPGNAAAQRLARTSTSRRRQLDIRIDRSDPVEFYVPTSDDDWALWCANGAAQQELRDITLEEEDILAGTSNLIVAEAKNDALIDDLSRTPSRRKGHVSKKKNTGHEETLARRSAESRDVKRALTGKQPITRIQAPTSQPKTETWQEIEERERLDTIERQRGRRR